MEFFIFPNNQNIFMNAKILVALLVCTCAHTSIAADKLLSMQQKYGFKMCQKITSEIKRASKLTCSVKDYKEYLKDNFYDCVLTNKKANVRVMSYQKKISDITFSKIFSDTDYGYSIGGKNITPNMVKNQLTKYGLQWSEIRRNDNSLEIYFVKSYTDDVESFTNGMVGSNIVLLPNGVPKSRTLTSNERKTIKYSADFDSLCGDFNLGYTYQFDANEIIKEIKFSSDIP